jgi:hypothetical protein
LAQGARYDGGATAHFSTALEREPLLVHNLGFSDECEGFSAGYSSLTERGENILYIGLDSDSASGAQLRDEDMETKTSAIETHATGVDNGGSYRKSGEQIGSPLGVRTEIGVAREQEMEADSEGVDRVDLAVALQEIENKKHKWYAYLTTRDFWIVLLLG